MGTKIKGQYMNRSTVWMIKYMNGSIFSKAKYMNGVGFEILACTPVPKLPLSYSPPSSPHLDSRDYMAKTTKLLRRNVISESVYMSGTIIMLQLF